MIVNIDKPVKLRLPMNEEEAHLIYEVCNYNESTQRCYIAPINSGLPIPPQEIVMIEDLENV